MTDPAPAKRGGTTDEIGRVGALLMGADGEVTASCSPPDVALVLQHSRQLGPRFVLLEHFAMVWCTHTSVPPLVPPQRCHIRVSYLNDLLSELVFGCSLKLNGERQTYD